MSLAYKVGTDPGATIYTDLVNVDVVALRVSQDGTPRVINSYDTDTLFEVLAGSGSYSCLWNVDGDTSPGSGVWENITGDNITVRYNSTDPSGYTDGVRHIFLDKTVLLNRRKEYNVSARLKGGELAGGLTVEQSIRVALDTYTGTPAATEPAEKEAEVPTLASPPEEGFADTPTCVTAVFVDESGEGYTAPPDVDVDESGGGGAKATATATLYDDWVLRIDLTAEGSGYRTVPDVAITGGGGTGATATARIAHTNPEWDLSQAWFEAEYGIASIVNDGYRLQYSTLDNPGQYGLTRASEGLPILCMVHRTCYDDGMKLEDLRSVAGHECKHAEQYIATASDGTDYQLLYANALEFFPWFMEAESYGMEITDDDSGPCWYYTANSVGCFEFEYAYARAAVVGISDGETKTAAKTLLQAVYDQIPFLEMKRLDAAGNPVYDCGVRAP